MTVRRALLPLLLATAMAAILPALLAAQAPPAGSRVLRGQVLDEHEKAVATAIVHLKNLTSDDELSVVTDKEGRYQFNDLDSKVDYEVYAEWHGQKSKTRSISQFDTRKRIFINLRLEPAKNEKDESEKKDKD